MKFAAAAAAFLASTIAAAPLEPRMMLPINVFNITDFKAYSVPHSSWSFVDFNVSVTTISPKTNCSASVLSYQSVGDAPETNCTEPTVAFNLTRTPDSGAEFKILWTFASPGLFEGTYKIPADQFVESGLETSVSEAYTGPTSFTISNLTLLQSVSGS